MTKYFNGFNNFLNYNKRVIQASIVRTIGSSPRNSDTEMFISETDTLGTIGGGQLEYLVINHSKKMIAENIKKDILKISLGPEIGQCCGGKVEVSAHVQDGTSGELQLPIWWLPDRVDIGKG